MSASEKELVRDAVEHDDSDGVGVDDNVPVKDIVTQDVAVLQGDPLPVPEPLPVDFTDAETHTVGDEDTETDGLVDVLSVDVTEPVADIELVADAERQKVGDSEEVDE